MTALDLSRNPLLGQAMGDRIGGPIRLALLLSNSVLRCGGLDTQHLTRSYLAWYESGAFDTGPIWEGVFFRVQQGVTAIEAAQAVHDLENGMTAGTNPAHRIAGLACARVVADEDVGEAARCEARLTHTHPQAGEASAATAVILRRLLRGDTFAGAVRFAAEQAMGEVATRLRDFGNPSPSGYAPETLAAAIYFTEQASSFSEALQTSVSFAGSANYCPVLVGAFAAATFGWQTVPGFELQPAVQSEASRVFKQLWIAS